ncbi:MAG: magnesium/cobalt transporter CorA [Hymenobacteraceae bacterium]|nr:magnesium/cobalt transporter CorA [Hymenobacteraceae bacterium]
MLRAQHRRATKRAAPIIGTAAGTLRVATDALPPRLFLISFDDDEVYEHEYTPAMYADMLATVRARPDLKHWLDVRGYGDQMLLEDLRDDFHLPALQMEDVLSDHQRPKVEASDEGNFFLVNRMLELQDDYCVNNDQLSIFTGPNYVISFQSDYDDCLNSLRVRLRSERSTVRRRPVLYVAYALLDTVLDFYFPVLNRFTEHIDDLEDRVFENASKELLGEILASRKELVKIRRLLTSERDMLNELLRYEAHLVPDELRPFIRDLYDHATQLIELAENAREALSNVAELYQSEVNTRMNQVMKVLTIISSIFIPLSFVTGVYGMNFQPEDQAGHKLPLNMPELYQPHGYPTLLIIMGSLVTLQLLFFWRRGWFR